MCENEGWDGTIYEGCEHQRLQGSWLSYKTALSDRDTKLISYLAKHNHWSPFAHCFVSFRISAPVFVARQLQKHTVGLAWNEVSRRYVDAEPTFYTPETWRKRAENVKQGSSDETVDDICMHWGDGTQSVEDIGLIYHNTYDACLIVYKAMLEAGVAPEQARMVLPQSMMTEWIWSGSLMAFARVCNLRLDSHAQYETRLVAEGIDREMAKLFPVSWKALSNG
jgi:thymidylate synthase (FAD)